MRMLFAAMLIVWLCCFGVGVQSPVDDSVAVNWNSINSKKA